MQFSDHFLSLKSKYSPQHLVLFYSQFMSFFDVRDQVSQPYKTTGEIIVLYNLILFVFRDET